VSVVVVGLNHRTVPLELLERMTVADATLPKALHDLRSRPSVLEAVVLSTCMRTEVYVETDRYHAAAGDVRNFLAELSGAPPEAFSDHVYDYYDDAAVAHLFGVAAGLDSAVLGEGEILGQVRTAWEHARAEDAAGPVLSSLFRHALEVGKRARTETAIARGVTSLAAAAVAMAADAVGSLAELAVLVVGTGEMGEGMALSLAARGVGRMIVASRSESRAEALATRVGGTAVSMDEVAGHLGVVDVMLTGTGAPGVLLSVDEAAAALARRGGRPLLIVDIAVPRDVDPGVRGLAGVRLLDMDDLVAFAEAGMAVRRGEIDTVRAIVAEEVERFTDVSTARTVAPLVAALHERGEKLRQAELDRLAGRLAGLDERQRRAIETLTRGLVAKLLHEPTVRLKAEAGTPRGERLAEALRSLFEL
jgi:glutamyl-tRNA reductase